MTTTAHKTISWRQIAEIQQAEKIVAVIDTLHRVDLREAQDFGVRIAELLVSQPDDLVQALDIIYHLHRSGVVECIVVDSTKLFDTFCAWLPSHVVVLEA